MDNRIAQSMNKQNRARGKPGDFAIWLNLMEVIASAPDKHNVGDPAKNLHRLSKRVSRKMKGLAHGHLNSAPMGSKGAVGDNCEHLRRLRASHDGHRSAH